MNLSELQSLILSGEKYFVKFGAEWCGPCRMMDNTIKTILSKYPELSDRVIVVDIEEHHDIATHYSIMSVPVSFYVSDGKYERKMGVQFFDQIVSWFF